MDTSRWERRLARERAARESAEHLLEAKSLELYQANQRLEALAASLEQRVLDRTAELQATAEALAEASQAKSEFLARMSHELRTPLNGVLGLLLLARDAVTDGHPARLLDRAAGSARSLLSIIGEVLDFSKIEAGRLELESTRFPLREVLDALAPLHAGHPNPEEIELFIRVRPDVPESLMGDPLRFRQVLVNLVGNALKYTATGHVLVELRCLSRSGGRVHLEMTVSDTGEGFPPEMASKLFEAFTQADGSITRRHGGTGLGLAITRGFVEAMGGTIHAVGRPGEGATFTFDAWFGDPDPLGQFTPVPGRALVVDDAPLARAVLGDALTALGLSVEEASGGLDAVQRVADAEEAGRPYDVVVLDWRMPDLDGVATLDRIEPMFGATPPEVVMVTAANAPDLDAALETRHVAAVLSKPVTRSRLHDALARRLARPVPVQTVARFDGVRALVVDDDETNRLVAHGLLSRIGVEPVTVDGGEAALEVLAHDTNFDIVFLDIRMPGMDGYACLSALRATHGPDLPVVMLSADVQPSAMNRARRLGADGFLAKPIEPDALNTTLSRWCTTSGTLDTDAEAEQMPTLPGIDADDALRRAGGDVAAWRSWMRGFAERHGERVREIRGHWVAGRTQAAADGLHTLRGSAANLGARTLAALLNTAEHAVHAGEAPELDEAEAMLDTLVLAVRAMPATPAPEVAAADPDAWQPALDTIREAIADAALIEDEVIDVVRSLGPARVGPEAVDRLIMALDGFDFEGAATELAAW